MGMEGGARKGRTVGVRLLLRGEMGQAERPGPSGATTPRRRTTRSVLAQPLGCGTAEHGCFRPQHGRRQRVFCASLADVFDNQVDPAWRADSVQAHS